MRSIAFAAISAIASLTVVPCFAETMAFKATLSPQSEVPPHPDLKGSGTLQATFDPATMMLNYSVSYDGLTGPATMAHFHGAAPVGKNAGVMVPIAGTLASPIKGTATLTAEQVKALEGGELYFNIHTDVNKAGELRGQVEKGM